MNDDIDKMMQHFDPAGSAPPVTPRADDETPRRIMAMDQSKGTDDDLVPSSPRKWLWMVVAGVVVLAVAIGGVLLARRPSEPVPATVPSTPGQTSDSSSQSSEQPSDARFLRLYKPADDGPPALDGCVPSWDVWVTTDPPGGPGEGDFGQLHPPLTLVVDAQVDGSIVGVFTSTAGTAICMAIPDDAGNYVYIFAYSKQFIDPASIQASPDAVQVLYGPIIAYWEKLGEAIPGGQVFMAGGVGANVTSVAVNLSDQTSVTAKIQAPYWIVVYPSVTADGQPVSPVSLTATLSDGTKVTQSL